MLFLEKLSEFGFQRYLLFLYTEEPNFMNFFRFFNPQVSKRQGEDTKFSYIFASPNFTIEAREILKTVLKSPRKALSFNANCDSKNIKKKFLEGQILICMTPFITLINFFAPESCVTYLFIASYKVWRS